MAKSNATKPASRKANMAPGDKPAPGKRETPPDKRKHVRTGKKPTGRPTLFTPELALRICDRLAAGEPLSQICKTRGYPIAPTVRDWVIRDLGGFSAMYASARDRGLDELGEQVLQIADKGSGDPARDRLRLDARRWYLSKLAPKRYGDRLDLNHSGSIDLASTLTAARKRANEGKPDD